MARKDGEHASTMFDWVKQTGRAVDLVLAMPAYHLKKKALLIRK